MTVSVLPEFREFSQSKTSTLQMTSISVIMTVFVLNFHWRAPEKFIVPKWIQKLVLKQLAYFMCIETDYNRRSKTPKSPSVPGSGPPTGPQSMNTQLPLNELEGSEQAELPMYSLNRITYGQIVNQMRSQLHDDDPGSPMIPIRNSAAQRRQLYAASSIHVNSVPQMQNNHVNRHENENSMRRRHRSASKDRLQEEVIRALTMLISRHEQDENILQV